MADKKKKAVPPPSVKVEGYVKVTLKGRTETLTMEEAEQLKAQLGAVLKERKEYVPYYPINVYPYNQWGWNTYPKTPQYDWCCGGVGGSSSGISTAGYLSTLETSKFLTATATPTVSNTATILTDFNPGDTLKVGDCNLTFIAPKEN